MRRYLHHTPLSDGVWRTLLEGYSLNLQYAGLMYH